MQSTIFFILKKQSKIKNFENTLPKKPQNHNHIQKSNNTKNYKNMSTLNKIKNNLHFFEKTSKPIHQLANLLKQ